MPRTPARSAADFFPDTPRLTLPLLRRAAQHCQGCDLYKHATHAVFGNGPAKSRVMLVGEQPGDQEDLAGQPFVGPAGKLLDKACLEAGLTRRDLYVTNAVKHFKWIPAPRGKRRVHAKPVASEIRACRPWLDAELALIRPAVLVLLGATAAQSLLGPAFRITKQRGLAITDTAFAPVVLATFHPSAILRAPDHDARAAQYALLVQDLKTARQHAR